MADSQQGDSRKISVRHTLGGSPRFCPHCLGKLEVASSISGWLVPNDYYCPNCGYRGPISFERDKSSDG